MLRPVWTWIIERWEFHCQTGSFWFWIGRHEYERLIG